jgi:hypothetical protein
MNPVRKPWLRFLVPLSVLAVLSASAWAQALDQLLALEELWMLKPAEFEQAAKGLPFQWTSNAQDSARAARPGMTFLGIPVVECVVRFDADKLREVTALFYARGDAGSISREKFEALVRQCAESLSGHTSAKPTPRGKDPSGAVKAEGIFWQTDKIKHLLEYSFTREIKSRGIDFRAEFVRLELAPAEKRSQLQSGPAQRQKFNGPSHVKRDPKGGDVYIADVPMVDQGQKGYCVVAATERVMRYYSVGVDANELAQVANSDASRGTSLDSMIEALKKIAARLRVRVREVEEQNVKSLLELMKDYNREAKRAKEKTLPEPGRMIDVASMYAAMKYELLREARTHNKSDLSKFQRTLQAAVDQGIPLLWCVQLGMFPEQGIPQNAGGHMRLLIGYNSSSQEVLYSDSWGAGHELKRMPAADAWTITSALTLVEPF